MKLQCLIALGLLFTLSNGQKDKDTVNNYLRAKDIDDETPGAAQNYQFSGVGGNRNQLLTGSRFPSQFGGGNNFDYDDGRNFGGQFGGTQGQFGNRQFGGQFGNGIRGNGQSFGGQNNNINDYDDYPLVTVDGTRNFGTGDLGFQGGFTPNGGFQGTFSPPPFQGFSPQNGGSFQGGFPNQGFNGGFPNQGFNGGFPPQGFNGGPSNQRFDGGFQGNFPTQGFNPNQGFNGGFNPNQGFNGGFNPNQGFNNGFYPNQGFNGGFNPNQGFNGGFNGMFPNQRDNFGQRSRQLGLNNDEEFDNSLTPSWSGQSSFIPLSNNMGYPFSSRFGNRMFGGNANRFPQSPLDDESDLARRSRNGRSDKEDKENHDSKTTTKSKDK